VEAIKLNLGCGYDIKEGYINIDMKQNNGVDIVVDLNECKLPFEDNTVDEIYMAHILEHIIDRYTFIQECYRVLKPNGVLLVKLPVGAVNLAHQSYFHRYDYFKCITDDKKTGGFQKNSQFKVVYQKRRLRRLISLYYRFRDWFLNLFTDEWEYKLEKR
jgi:predicted SAM-dependent methyltransferase